MSFGIFLLSESRRVGVVGVVGAGPDWTWEKFLQVYDLGFVPLLPLPSIIYILYIFIK